MIEVWKLTSRHVDANKGDEIPQVLEQVKIFSTYIGHGIGTVDFNEKIAEISDDEYEKMLANSGEYVKFKIGNLSKFYEVEIRAEHVKELLKDLCECKLKDILANLKGAYLVLRLKV